MNPINNNTLVSIPESDIPTPNIAPIAAPAIPGFETDPALLAVKQDFENEQKYGAGTAPAKAALAAAARGTTLGASDWALVHSGLVDAFTLDQLKKQNPISSNVGEVAGLVAPGLITGGGSVAARAIPAVGAEVIGAAAEKLTAKAISNLIAESGSKAIATKLLQNAIPKAVGSSVLGSFYGLGNLVSEHALGNAEVNAENLMASIGSGALIGGVAGGLFGSVGPVAEAIVGDTVKNAIKYLKITPTQLEKINPETVQNLPNLLRDVIGIKTTTGKVEELELALKARKQTGKELGTLIEEIEPFALSNPSLMPSKPQVFTDLTNILDSNYLNKYTVSPAPGVSATVPQYISKLKPIQELREDYAKLAMSSEGSFSAKELNKLRQDIDNAAGLDKVPGVRTLTEKANYDMRVNLRKAIDDMALTASTDPALAGSRDLFTELNTLNKNYSQLLEVIPFLKKNANKDSNFLGMGDVIKGFLGEKIIDVVTKGHIAGGAAAALAVGAGKALNSGAAQKLRILVGMEKQNNSINGAVTSSIKDFLYNKTNALAQPITGSVMSSELAKENLKTNPKSNIEAITNIGANLSQLNSDPAAFMEKLRQNTAALGTAAPETQAQLIQQVMKAAQLIQSQLPADRRTPSIFSGPWNPSDHDLKAFNQTVEVVENPLKALERFKTGSLTAQDVITLRAVYPNLLGSMQQTALAEFGKMKDNGGTIPYSKQTQISLLMGAPVTAGMDARSLQLLQGNFNVIPPLSKTPGSLAKFHTENISTNLEKISKK